MESIVIQGRGVIPGRVEGRALVCPKSITGWGGIDPVTGVIKDHDNPNKGQSIQGTILVMPGSKGSNGWSCYFSITRVSGVMPLGLVFTKVDSSSAVAATGMGIPTVVEFPPDCDPCRLIRSGDTVAIDGSTGIVTITRP